ncbi:MauE/DoxX family redox-associated membrane protein [Solicola gregarius]|uniref:Methylamine utilisation protein MauE domain-containing protein n=1 Tax=Solicola gregarius TaxID=2908642 RepID=A0AA46YJX7_9ACTN|nr:MauE/DoxX family redox-associated membrane protein [Solicola gregarius]UYM05070.1 hypothetical protein L0C25_21525 [Solicola gregarius]
MDLLSTTELVVGLVLVWAGVGKMADPHMAGRARRSALPRLVGESRAPAAYRATGLIELVVGAALLLPPFWWLEGVASTVLTMAFLGYLTYARRSDPESSCGCLGSAEAPVSARSIARGVLLVAASVATALAGDGWTTPMRERPWSTVGLVLLGLAVIVALSPELDRRWLLPLRRMRVRLTHPLATAPKHVPIDSTVHRVMRSSAYRAVGASIRSDVLEQWDADGWRFVTYAAVRDDTSVTAVFAVPLTSGPADSVRVALVDEATGETIYRGGGAALAAT